MAYGMPTATMLYMKKALAVIGFISHGIFTLPFTLVFQIIDIRLLTTPIRDIIETRRFSPHAIRFCASLYQIFIHFGFLSRIFTKMRVFLFISFVEIFSSLLRPVRT